MNKLSFISPYFEYLCNIIDPNNFQKLTHLLQNKLCELNEIDIKDKNIQKLIEYIILKKNERTKQEYNWD